MKRFKNIISIALAAILLITVAALVSGCGNKEKAVDAASRLEVDGNFAGSRSVTLTFSSELDGDTLENALRENLPVFDGDSNAYTLSEPTRTGAKSTEYTFAVNFSSKDDYESKVSQLIGREASVMFAQPDNVLVKGMRLSEDFSAGELINWVTDALSQAISDYSPEYNYVQNLISVAGKVYLSEEAEININEVKGYPVESIRIETINTKDGAYERRFTFTVKNSIFEELGESLKNYFDDLTDIDRADFNGWSLQGENQEYMVIYQNLDITALNEVTAQMLGAQDCKIFYGDNTNSSTPLSEGLNFAEELNLSNFFSGENSPVPLYYTYSLPTETTHGDGQIYNQGQWTVSGEWTGSTFTYSSNKNALRLIIPDGIQYKIEGINYTLQNLGDGLFTRSMDFLFPTENGQKAQSYAYDYFAKRGVNVSKLDVDGFPTCRVTMEGTPLEISVQAVELFGAGNYMDYSSVTPSYSLTTNTTFKDYVNISSLLNAENSLAPMKYTVLEGSGESLRELECGYADLRQSVSKPDKSGSFSVSFTGGRAEVTYRGAAPNPSAVRGYAIFAVLLFVAVIAVIVLLCYMDIRRRKQRKPAENINGGQTTRFSIKEVKEKAFKKRAPRKAEKNGSPREGSERNKNNE